MKKTLLCTIALAGSLTLLTSGLAYASEWQKDENGWWYAEDDGSYPADTWEQIDGTWYYFDSQGYIITGWFQQGDDLYYLDESGAMLQSVTRNIDGTEYSFDGSGRMIFAEGAQAAANTSRQQMEQWFYATYAVIANETSWNAEYFLSQPGTYQNEAKMRLSMAWGVTDKASAQNVIDRLITGMHRISYQDEMDILRQLGYMDLTDSQLKEVFASYPFVYDMITAYKNSGEGAIDAWDYCRAMQVIRETYLAGYFTEIEELDKMLEVAKILQSRFGSWDEMAESYARGYEYWKGSPSAYQSRKESYEELKAAASYYQIDWNTPLNKAW